MVQPRYLAAFFLATLLWCDLFLAFTLIVNPYGVSPVRVSWSRVNQFKPKRLDIDRLIKPYEVWRYQPRTVFLGTSRILQSIDPSVLDGTAYAPAYNASIPASTLDLNATHLEQYIELDKDLKFAFVELFFYNFVFPNNEEPRKSLTAFLENSAALHLSVTTLLDSIQTVEFNRSGTDIGAYVHPRGYWVPPSTPYTKLSFESYVDSIMKIHKEIPDMILQPTVFQSLDKIVEICRRNGVKLYLLITPNHPYDDYRLLSLGYWQLLEDWHRRLANYPNVISFSQYHAPLEEPISEKMNYWNDPVHVNLNMGRLMLRSFLGNRDPEIPDNMMIRVNQQDVETVLEERRNGLEKWMARNREFTAAFDKAKFATGNDRSQRQGK